VSAPLVVRVIAIDRPGAVQIPAPAIVGSLLALWRPGAPRLTICRRRAERAHGRRVSNWGASVSSTCRRSSFHLVSHPQIRASGDIAEHSPTAASCPSRRTAWRITMVMRRPS
jgi:hypothetical protein